MEGESRDNGAEVIPDDVNILCCVVDAHVYQERSTKVNFKASLESYATSMSVRNALCPSNS